MATSKEHYLKCSLPSPTLINPLSIASAHSPPPHTTLSHTHLPSLTSPLLTITSPPLTTFCSLPFPLIPTNLINNTPLLHLPTHCLLKRLQSVHQTIHEWVSEPRLIMLVVSVQPVTLQVNYNVLVIPEK